MSPVKFQSTHRAIFHQIDGYGHLNTLHYLDYFLSHRFMALRVRFDLGLREINALEIAFYTKKIDIYFVRPVLGDQEFRITSYVSETEEKSCRVVCDMEDSNARVLATYTISLVCVDKKSGRPVPWPDGFMERFYE